MATPTHIRGKLYTHLVRLAVLQQTTTYEELALKFGLPSSGNALGATLSPILGDIFYFCERCGQPRLPSLVVRKSGAQQGLPGRGFWSGLGLEDLDDDSKRLVLKSLHSQVFTYFEDLA